MKKLLLLLLSILLILTIYNSRQPSPPAPPAPINLLAAVATAPPLTPPTPVFGHAVVPQGIHTKQEFLNAYPDATDNVRLIRLGSSIQANVSYVRDGKTYWTQTPHVYAAGTAVWTDGKIFVLARCGNQLGWALPAGAVVEEFPPLDLDEPVTPVRTYAPVDAPPVGTTVYAYNPPTNDPQPPVSEPPVYPPVYYPPIPGNYPTVTTPEPATLLLFLIGLAVLIAWVRLSR